MTEESDKKLDGQAKRSSDSSLLNWDESSLLNWDENSEDQNGEPVQDANKKAPRALESETRFPLSMARKNSESSLLSTNGSTKAESDSKKVPESKVRWSNAIPKRRSSTADDQTSSMGDVPDNKKGIWTKMARKTSVWEEDTGDNAEEYAMMHCLQNTWTEFKVSMQIKWRIIRHHPHIPVITTLVFLALSAGGLIITYAYAKQYEQQQHSAALNVASEFGTWFRDQLAQAELPLFALSQFVPEVPAFRDLPLSIGKEGDPGAAPLAGPAHRAVFDICTNPVLTTEFDRIAERIKEGANMTKTLVNLQYAPFGVVCLLYPLINYEDFSNGNYLNNTGAIGLDLLIDPAQRAVAESTVTAGHLVFAGPITLRQCLDCPPVVRQAFIARLPIPSRNITFDLNGKEFNWWGFATGLINWEEMVDRSGMVQYFDERNQHFVLQRTDKLYDVESGNYFTEQNVLVESVDHGEHDRTEQFANASLKVTNNDWNMSVYYQSAWDAPFVAGAIVGTFAISALIAFMLLEVLVERQAHKNLIKEMLPKKAMHKIQRGEVVAESYNIATIFFSDIVGYTTLSAEMRPIKVMKLLNSFYTEVDKIADKHGVYKIETIGDAYMCVGGCPDRCLGPEGAEKVALFALDMIELVKNFRTEDGSQILIRAGINSGPVVAGVVGTTRPQFTIFGDAVNAASRMESTSEKMKIQCSDFTYRLLRDAPNFNFRMKERGNVHVKGKGHMNTWWIEGVQDSMINNDSYSGASTNPLMRRPELNLEKSPEDSTVSAESDDKKHLDDVDRDPMDEV